MAFASDVRWRSDVSNPRVEKFIDEEPVRTDPADRDFTPPSSSSLPHGWRCLAANRHHGFQPRSIPTCLLAVIATSEPSSIERRPKVPERCTCVFWQGAHLPGEIYGVGRCCWWGERILLWQFSAENFMNFERHCG